MTIQQAIAATKAAMKNNDLAAANEAYLAAHQEYKRASGAHWYDSTIAYPAEGRAWEEAIYIIEDLINA